MFYDKSAKPHLGGQVGSIAIYRATHSYCSRFGGHRESPDPDERNEESLLMPKVAKKKVKKVAKKKVKKTKKKAKK
jgi:hypothetical protein